MKLRTPFVAATAVAALVLAGCSTDADVVSQNISKAADQFEVNRRIVFINGITDKYLLSVEGRCNVEDGDGLKVTTTCRLPDGTYKKHYLGRSDNVTYFIEQLDAVSASSDHYRVIFKPEVIVPDIDRP